MGYMEVSQFTDGGKLPLLLSDKAIKGKYSNNRGIKKCYIY